MREGSANRGLGLRGGGEPWSRDGPIARSGDRKRAREPRRSHEGAKVGRRTPAIAPNTEGRSFISSGVLSYLRWDFARR